MMIAHDNFFRAPAKWIPYQKEATWVLRGGQGKKSVAVKFRDEAGNESRPIMKLSCSIQKLQYLEALLSMIRAQYL